jgi:hypothetical protein
MSEDCEEGYHFSIEKIKDEEGMYNITFSNGKSKKVPEFLYLEGYEKKYKVYIDGRIFNTVKNEFVNFRKEKNYLIFSTWFNDKEKRLRLSKIIYNTFIGEIPFRYHICYKDKNINNCNLNNLCIKTATEIKLENNPIQDYTEFGMPIVGFSNYYISKTGEVYSALSNKIINSKINDEKYAIISIHDVKTNTTKKLSVHRLVYEAYGGILEEDKVIDHINRDRNDNDISNLRQVTSKENSNNRSKYIANTSAQFVDNFDGFYPLRLKDGKTCNNWGYMVNIDCVFITKHGLILHQHVRQGYFNVTLTCDDGKRNQFSCHILYCLVFKYDTYKPGLYVNHINENKLDNNYDNLEWCTPKQNTQHSLGVKICQIDKNTQKIIKIHNSYSEVSDDLNLKRLSKKDMTNTFENETLFHGFFWKLYEEGDEIDKYIERKNNIKSQGQKICKIDPVTKNIVNIFNSYTEVGNDCGIKHINCKSMREYIENGITYHNFYWKLYNENDFIGKNIFIIQKKKDRAIKDKICKIYNMKIVKIYSSYSEIAKEFNVKFYSERDFLPSFEKGKLFKGFNWKLYEEGDIEGDIYEFNDSWKFVKKSNLNSKLETNSSSSTDVQELGKRKNKSARKISKIEPKNYIVVDILPSISAVKKILNKDNLPKNFFFDSLWHEELHQGYIWHYYMEGEEIGKRSKAVYEIRDKNDDI